MTVRGIKRLLGDEGAVQSGIPANIQFRIVSINRAGSSGCPSGSRLAIPAVGRQGYSSEAEGLSGTTVPSPMSALCSINSVIRKYRNGLSVRQFKTALPIAIGVNPKKRGCVLGMIPNRAAPFIQIETNSVKGYTIADCQVCPAPFNHEAIRGSISFCFRINCVWASRNHLEPSHNYLS